jgi:hypothetical protein
VRDSLGRARRSGRDRRSRDVVDDLDDKFDHDLHHDVVDNDDQFDDDDNDDDNHHGAALCLRR